MPELPEVETTRKGIAPYLLDGKITRIQIHNARLRWPIPETIHQLCNSAINNVSRRGKYLLLSNSSGTALIHLGMSGSLRICDNNSERRKHDHVEFVLPSGKVLRFHDPRRFGCILWDKGDASKHPLLVKLGPEPLDPAFSNDYLFQSTRNRKAPIKNLIMDSHRVVGIGNIYASESLFLAGIRPGKAGMRLSRNNCKKLTDAIKQVLARAIEDGGTTLRDFVNSEGNPGYFAQSLHVYGRKGEPCNYCGATIKSKTLGQRASYYCPSCQS